MPKIELNLPGGDIADIRDIAEIYRITLERGDGKRCSETEAWSTLSAFLMTMKLSGLQRGAGKRKKP